MTSDPIKSVKSLGFPWVTIDPFLFCVHHDDAYPAGNEHMGPAASLSGRKIGMDFEGIDGWRMYHGDVVPGFPRHPHRGFETITVARSGYIDHSDSLGATARFGHGDVQWMTAGRGIVHSEMFPLVERERPNPAELFQIWINLPRADKMVEPHFAMLWNDSIPRHTFRDANDRTTDVAVIAGHLDGVGAPPSPPPNSWASRSASEVAIWTLKMQPGAEWSLPAATAGTNRMLYLFRGAGMSVGRRALEPTLGIRLVADAEVPLINGAEETELLMLQGKPIGEPVVHHGPFVMNTPGEIHQAMADYRRTEYGGWPWPSDGPVHPRHEGRFAIHADGRKESAS